MLYYSHMAKRIDHAARRQFIVERSMGLFARLGYAKVSFLTISEATGVARTALYRYFKTKREIFDEAIHGCTHAIKVSSAAIAVQPLPVPERLNRVADRVIDTLFERKQFLLAIYAFVIDMVRRGEDMRGRIAQFTGGLRELFLRLLEEGARRGELSANVDPRLTSDVLFALLESVVLRILLGVERDAEKSKLRFSAMVRSIAGTGTNKSKKGKGN